MLMQNRLRHPLEMMMWTRTWQLTWGEHSVLIHLPCPSRKHPQPSKMQNLTVSSCHGSLPTRNMCQMTRFWSCPPTCHYQRVSTRCCGVPLASPDEFDTDITHRAGAAHLESLPAPESTLSDMHAKITAGEPKTHPEQNVVLTR